jgi:hypothetical protein
MLGAEFEVTSLGVHGEFGQSAYSADELYAKHHIDTDAIVSAAEKLITSKGSYMNLDTDVLKARWKDISALAMKKWDSISEKDLEKVKGNAVAMVAMFQEKFGVSREEASKKVDELLSKYRSEELKDKVEKTAGKIVGTATTLAGTATTIGTQILGTVKDKMKK